MNSPTTTQSDFEWGDWSAGITATAGSRIAAAACASAAWGWVERTCAVCLLIVDHRACGHSLRAERRRIELRPSRLMLIPLMDGPASGRFGPCMPLQLTRVIAVSPPAIVTVTQ